MNRVWVANASPLIVLAKVGAFHLLERLPAHLVVPSGVWREVQACGQTDPAACALAASPDLEVRVESLDEEIVEWDLGRGESEVLTWARRNPGAEALLDDRQARSAAEALGLAFRGSLGVILLGKRHGLIEAAGPLIWEMRAMGLRLSDELIAEALRLAGEGQAGS